MPVGGGGRGEIRANGGHLQSPYLPRRPRHWFAQPRCGGNTAAAPSSREPARALACSGGSGNGANILSQRCFESHAVGETVDASRKGKARRGDREGGAHVVCSAGATAGRSLRHPRLHGPRADAAEPRPDHATDRHLQPRCRLVLSSKTKPHSTVHVAEHPSLDSESPSSHSSLELDDTSPLPHGALHEDCPHSGSVHTHPCSTEQKLSRQRLPVPAATAQVRCTKHICLKPSNSRGLTKARFPSTHSNM